MPTVTATGRRPTRSRNKRGTISISQIGVFSAAAIEMVCRALAEAVTGPQIPNLISPLGSLASPDIPGVTKWKRLNNAVVSAQNRQGDGRPLDRLVTEVMKPVRFSDNEEFQRIRSAVNVRLLLSGLEVRTDGRVGKVSTAATLSDAQRRANALEAQLKSRGVHADVLHFCRPELLHSNYFHAILEASKSVAEKLRRLTNSTGDGAALVDSTCSISSGPILRFNSLATETEKSEQTGLSTLMKGLFSAYRNPTAHAPKALWVTDEQEALDVLTLCSMLHRRLDMAKV